MMWFLFSPGCLSAWLQFSAAIKEKWKKHNCRSHAHTYTSHALRVWHTFHRPVIPALFKKRVGVLSVALLNGKHTLACPEWEEMLEWEGVCGHHEPCTGSGPTALLRARLQQEPALMGGPGLTKSQPCVVCVWPQQGLTIHEWGQQHLGAMGLQNEVTSEISLLGYLWTGMLIDFSVIFKTKLQRGFST